MRIHRREEGAALVEFALVATLLFTILFGIIEFGLAFRDWLSVTSATREGARVASAAGNDPAADCYILDAMTGPLLAVPTDDAATFKVTIFKADSNGDPIPGVWQVYVPFDGTNLDLTCTKTWTAGPGNGGYEPATRGVNAGSLDTIGVRIEFTHQWVTNFWPVSGEWTDDAVMRMEPKGFPAS